MSPKPTRTRPLSRRGFLAGTAAAGAALAAAPHVHSAGGDVLRVGLIGCGNRGTGAAAQALRADPNVKLVALGDAFEDRIRGCLETLRQDEKVAGKIDVSRDRCFAATIACRGVGVAITFVRMPASRSQMIWMPKKIATNSADWARMPGMR